MKNHIPRFCRLLRVLAILAFASAAQAQGDYVLGTAVSLTGGGSSRPQFFSPSQTSVNSVSKAFYGVYPSLDLTAMRRNSTINAHYGFGFNRTIGSTSLPTASHTASLNFSTKLSPRWSLAVLDSFRMTDGLGTFDALSGAAAQAGISAFSFQSVAARQFPRTNAASANLSWALDATSNVSIRASHSLTNYSAGTAPTTGFFTNQQQMSGGVLFRQQTGRRDSWGLSYDGTYFDYGNSQRSISQSAMADYSLGIGRDLTMQIGAGVSQVDNHGAPGQKLNYEAMFGIAKILQANSISLNFTQSSTDRVGIGSTAVTRRGTLAWNRGSGKVSTSATISAYRSYGTLNNPLDVDGITGTARLGFTITRKLSVSGAGDYQTTETTGVGFTQRRLFYTANVALAFTNTLSLSAGGTYETTRQSGISDFTHERVFLALRYSQPNLLRFR